MVKEKQNNNKNTLKKVAALGIMFSVGVSAFAAGNGNGSLGTDMFSYNADAVTDVVNLLDTLKKSKSDGIVDQKEQETIRNMQSQFDKDYGPGSCKFIVNTMAEYLKTPGGKSLIQQSDDGIVFVINKAVREANTQQYISNLNGSTLADYQGFER